MKKPSQVIFLNMKEETISSVFPQYETPLFLILNQLQNIQVD